MKEIDLIPIHAVRNEIARYIKCLRDCISLGYSHRVRTNYVERARSLIQLVQHQPIQFYDHGRRLESIEARLNRCKYGKPPPLMHHVCSWCHDTIGWIVCEPSQRGTASHGICATCQNKQLGCVGDVEPSSAAEARDAAMEQRYYEHKGK